ncbi:MAG: aminopeptidase P family N-terminal domain-containing protein, partial [Lachnospiraceae bacterium]|nr:aminopeptidase P family N-terminal domain-containing protein [Lachnospiraceae bacterium]
MTNERLKLLREKMRKYRIDMYLVFLSDDHSSEYVGDHFKETEFLTGFTGSNATLLITKETAGLWTDGRYFVQAAKEIRGSGFTLFKMGEEDVPGVSDFVKEHLEKGMRLGYDGRRVTAKEHRQYELYAKKAKASIDINRNLVDAIWKDRPPLSFAPVWILDEPYAGVGIEEKLAAVRKKMEEAGAKAHLLTSLCDIAWLLNLRGNDITHVPVFLSFLYITEKRVTLYANKDALDKDVKAYLKAHKVAVRAYDAVYRDMARVGKVKFLYDPAVTNAALYSCFASKVIRVEQKNPTEGLKCVKNETEIANTRQAHILDGLAVT